MQIIDGKILADKIKDEVVEEIAGGRTGVELLNCERPNLAIILVGNREDSELYVGLKEREAKKVGIDTHLYKFDDDVAEQDLLDVIDFLNNDESIDAILIQLPLPDSLNTDKIIQAMKPEKDIDGFHPENLKKLLGTCNFNSIIMPPVYGVVFEMLDSLKYDLKDEEVCILANSDIFGESLKKILECRGAKVQVVKMDDKKREEKIKEADLLITAIGKPKFIKGGMIKKGAVIIDIGINRQDDKVCGDVDFDDVGDVASFVTPVPGGVGPITIAMAFKNIVKVWKK